LTTFGYSSTQTGLMGCTVSQNSFSYFYTFLYKSSGAWSRPVNRLASHLLLWAQDRAIHVPGSMNMVLDIQSWKGPSPWKLRIHSAWYSSQRKRPSLCLYG